MSAVFAVDLGATFLRTGLVERDGRLMRRTRLPTPATAAECAAALRAAWLAAGSPLPVGVAAAPLCDAAGRVIRWPNRPGYEDGTILPDEWTGRVRLIDDGDAAALAADPVVGAAGSVTVCLQIGTGIGAGAVVDGRLLVGRTASAMALGHIKVPAAAGLACSCGATGCLQAAASGRAFRRLLGPDDDPAFDIFALPRAAADPVLDRAADAVAEALTLIVGLLDPHRLAIGGSLGLSPFFDRVTTRFARPGQVVPVRNPAGADAPLLGAARYACAGTT